MSREDSMDIGEMPVVPDTGDEVRMVREEHPILYALGDGLALVGEGVVCFGKRVIQARKYIEEHFMWRGYDGERKPRE